MNKKYKIITLTKPYGLNYTVIRWLNSFATCAIEGNLLGREMCDLWNSGKVNEFVRRLEQEWQPELREAYEEQKSE